MKNLVKKIRNIKSIINNKVDKLWEGWRILFGLVLIVAAILLEEHVDSNDNYSYETVTISDISDNYDINTPIKLKKTVPSIEELKGNNLISNLKVERGYKNGFLIRLISYESKNKSFSENHSSRDSLVKYYFQNEGYEFILDDERDIKSKELLTLRTDGCLKRKNTVFTFKSLSDYDKNNQRNWHLLLVYKNSVDNDVIANDIIGSRKFK